MLNPPGLSGEPLLGAISALAQDVYYTLGEALSRVENTSEYLQEMRETSIKQLTHKTFHSQVLPQISLHASVPSYLMINIRLQKNVISKVL